MEDNANKTEEDNTKDKTEEDDTEEGRAARDAQTNTNSNEPMVLTCSVCKHQLNSAWSLMQHMQVQSLS